MPAPPVVPALPDTPRITSYSISSATGPFAVNFALYGDETDFGNWIQVYLGETLLNAATDYVVSSPTGPLGAIPLPITDALVTLTAPSTGTLTILGARRPRRITQFPESRGVAARDLNQAFTDSVAEARENWDFIRTRALLLGGIASVSGTNTLPVAALRANKVLAFDGAGNPLLQTLSGGGGGAPPGGVVPNVQYNVGGGFFGGLTDVQLTARIQSFTTALSGAVPASGAATGTHFLNDAGTFTIPAGGGGGTPGGSNLQIQYNNAGSFGGLTDVQVTARIQAFTTALSGAVPASGASTGTHYLSDSGTFTIPAGTPGGSNLQIQYNNAGAFGGLTDVQVTARIQTFTTALSGAVPASGAATGTHFLNDMGTFTIPAGGGGGSPGGASLTIQYNNGGAFGGLSGSSWDDINRALTMTGATVTTSHPFESWTQTWNGPGLTFTGYLVNITDTASAAASKFMDWQIAGVSKFSVGKDGSVNAAALNGTKVTLAGATSGVVTIQPQAVAGTYNANLPTSAGTAGQFLTSQGGGSTAMTWTTGLTGPGVTQKGGYPVWNTATGGTVLDGQGPANVLAFGADPTGAADSTTAFNNAWAVTPLIYVPRGKYKIGSQLVAPAQHGAGIIGDGPWSTNAAGSLDGSGWTSSDGGTLISVTQTTLDAIVSHTGMLYPTFVGFTLLRTSQATNGYGLNMNPILNLTVSGAVSGTAGVVRLTVNSISAAIAATPGFTAFVTGNFGQVSGVGGTTEANGGWTFTVVDNTHIELQGSSFVHAYTSGGAVVVVGTNDRAYLSNLRFANHSVGIYLGSTGHSVAADIFSESNRNAGIEMNGQWQLLNLFSANNGSYGFLVDAIYPASCGQWRGLSTFGNGNFGLYINGQRTSQRIEGIRLSDSFFGGDAVAEISCDSYGANPAQLTNVHCEGNAGVNAYNFTVNNPTILLSNSVGTTAGSTGNGLVFACPHIMISNCEFLGNTSTGSGIIAVTGAVKASVVSTRVNGFANNILLSTANAAGLTAASVHACDGAGSISVVCATPSTVGNY
jgi:hypothetical protein